MWKFSIEPVGVFARHLNLIDRQEFYIYGFNTSGYHSIIKGVLSTKKSCKILSPGHWMHTVFLVPKVNSHHLLVFMWFWCNSPTYRVPSEHLQSRSFHQIGIWWCTLRTPFSTTLCLIKVLLPGLS